MYVCTYIPTYIHAYIHTYIATYLQAHPTYMHTRTYTCLHTATLVACSVIVTHEPSTKRAATGDEAGGRQQLHDGAYGIRALGPSSPKAKKKMDFVRLRRGGVGGCSIFRGSRVWGLGILGL